MLTTGRKKAEDKIDFGEKIRNSASVMFSYVKKFSFSHANGNVE